MKQFSSYDLALSAALATLGHQLMGGEQEEISQKILFFFLDSEKLRKDVETYYAGSLSVEPQRYFANLKIIKNLIHSYDKNK